MAAETRCPLDWACAILPEHTHLVIARHDFKVEYIANLLEGVGTKERRKEALDPLAPFARPDKPRPSPWSARRCKVFLDSEDAIDNAIHYVEENQEKEGKPRQQWGFVTPFAGMAKGGHIAYH